MREENNTNLESILDVKYCFKEEYAFLRCSHVDDNI